MRRSVFNANTNGKFLSDVVGVFHREEVFCGSVEFLKILRVAQEDPFLLPPFEREDSHLEHVAFHHFQQRRITTLVEDVGVDFLATLAGDHAAFVQLAKHIHRQPGNRSVLRKREVERAFGVPGVVVEESLIDRRAGNSVFDINVNVILSQGKFGFLPIRVDRDQAVFTR